MNKDSEDFSALRKLMALKRHELPPPGYFDRLPGSIIARIERGDGQLNFWERVAANLTLRPAFAYAFALAACGALTASVYSVKMQSAQASLQSSPTHGWRGAASGEAFANGFDPAQGPHVANWLGNTNPEAIPTAFPPLFAVPERTLPVSYEKRN